MVLTDHGGKFSHLGVDLGSMDLADRIVAYSDFGASQYETRTPVEIIKGGVDSDVFRPAERPIVRDRVLYVGRLLPHKGVDQLIEALPPELPLTVCGQPYHAEYFELLQRLSEGKQVEFVTDADDETIVELYRRSWVNVLPSVYHDCYGGTHDVPELMGFTLLEAMACGTPAICSRVGAMPEFVRHGETGFVFDTRDGLAAQLSHLAGDPDLVARMGRRARREVEELYSLKVAGRTLYQVYQNLIRGTREAAA
jgi:glycosyltransferase involved in cell wall biosynthesis